MAEQGELVVGRSQDQVTNDGIVYIKDSSFERDLEKVKKFKNQFTEQGWQAFRFAFVDKFSDKTNLRIIERDSITDRRFKLAKLQHDAIHYRDHRKENVEEKDASHLDFAAEFGSISDWEEPFKKTVYEPSFVHTRNRSTLVFDQSTELLKGAEKKFPESWRKFGREHDTQKVVSTQKITINIPILKKNKKVERLEEAKQKGFDGIYKLAWNITPNDKPLERTLKRLNEHNSGPGVEGFDSHDYPPNLPIISSCFFRIFSQSF